MAERRVVLSPIVLEERDHGSTPLDLLRRAALFPASAVGSVQNQVAYLFGMTCGIGNGHSATLRDPQQWKTLQLQSVDDALKVVDPCLK